MEASNPIVAELWRGNGIESIHRGAWVLVDTDGTVVDRCGDPEQLVYARSSTKSMQALALVETIGPDELSDAEIAVAIASHNGEPIHAAAARELLARVGLDDDALQCGPQAPAGAGASEPGSRIANNCSGKHAGFLAAAVASGDDPQDYLDPASQTQRRVAEAISALTGSDPSTITTAIDGCSAPTFRMPLRGLATGLARMANPVGFAPQRVLACERIVEAGTNRPDLVGGTSTPRFDTEVMKATNGRLFAKGGAEAVQAVGVVGAGLGLAAKIDDGSARSLHRLVLAVLASHDLIRADELGGLAAWTDPVRRNRDGLEVGRHALTAEALGSR